jgi:hypothetical protein
VELAPIADAPAHPASSPAPTVGAALEHVRLVHRERRLERMLDALHVRARARAISGPVPAGLSESIGEFSRELDQVRERLAMSSVKPPTAALTVLGRASA